MLRLGKKIIIERISSTIFLYQINLSWTLNNVDQFGNNRMIQLRKNIDLPLEIL
jgi:hypothetical protein